MQLSPLFENFVLHFGEMGNRWGINRTVGQMYALLYLSSKPLNAEEIAESLGFSRSNVSMGLKELDAWRLIRIKHLPGDRRDHFSTPNDIWEIVRTLIEERRKREIEPTLSMLREVLLEHPGGESEQYAQQKMREMHDLIEMLTDWHSDMQKMETERLVKLLKLGTKIVHLYEMKDKITLVNLRKKKKPAKNIGGL